MIPDSFGGYFVPNRAIKHNRHGGKVRRELKDLLLNPAASLRELNRRKRLALQKALGPQPLFLLPHVDLGIGSLRRAGKEHNDDEEGEGERLKA
jgi:hypothetical protein